MMYVSWFAILERVNVVDTANVQTCYMLVTRPTISCSVGMQLMA
jgi:hypothetical protein